MSKITSVDTTILSDSPSCEINGNECRSVFATKQLCHSSVSILVPSVKEGIFILRNTKSYINLFCLFIEGHSGCLHSR